MTTVNRWQGSETNHGEGAALMAGLKLNSSRGRSTLESREMPRSGHLPYRPPAAHLVRLIACGFLICFSNFEEDANERNTCMHAAPD